MKRNNRTQETTVGNDAHKDQTLPEAEERFGAVFDRSLDVILIVDSSNGRILRANPSAPRVLDYEEESLQGKLVSELQRDLPEEPSTPLHEDLRAHDATFQSMEFVRADGSICPMDMTATMIPWNGRQAILLTLRDVTERKRMEEELRIAATYDALTGLYNRRHLMEQLEAGVGGAKRHRFPFSLALCDVDDFKSVNDTYGHAAGDDVLAQLSGLVREAIRTATRTSTRKR